MSASTHTTLERLPRSLQLGLLLALLALLALLWAARSHGPEGAGVGAVFLSMMVLPVLGLVLVEQLFRNVARDGRWGVKPLCLALAGVFCSE